MSEALPALAFGAINSVIALFGNPPPVIRSRTSTPVDRMVVGGGEGWGKRAASNFRRSTTLLADMPDSGIRFGYVQANISPEGLDVLSPSVRLCRSLNDAVTFDEQRPHVAIKEKKLANAAKDTKWRFVAEHVA